MSMSHPAMADIIRGRQVHAVEQNIMQAIIGLWIGAVISTVLFYRTWGCVLVSWDVGLFVVLGLRLVLALRTLKAPPAPVGVTRIRWMAVLSAAVAMTAASGPAWIGLNSPGLVGQIMLTLAIGIYWCGTLICSPVRSWAMCFAGGHATVWLLVCCATGFDWDRCCFLMLNIFGAAWGSRIGLDVGQLFERHLLQWMDLEAKTIDLQRQADLIGMLLQEHEDQSSDWLWQTDGDLRLLDPSPRCTEAFGRPAAAICGTSVPSLLAMPHVPGNAEAITFLSDQVAARRAFRDALVPLEIDGEPRWFSVSGRPSLAADGALVCYRGVMADRTAAESARAQVDHLARHDLLTGLANRSYFHRRLDRGMAHAGGDRVAVLSIDLDGFKPVNDHHGHPVGDALLITVADRLRGEVDEAGLVARMGGDEFAIKIRRPLHEVELLCRRLITVLSDPVLIDGGEIRVGASIGVAFAPTDGTTADALVISAEAALYRAKQDGRGTFRFFARDMDQHLQQRQVLTHDLRSALARGEFTLHYQPFVHSGSGDVTGFEALLRWQHPGRGLISPLDFIPLAEETGLIVPIGAWVIETACEEAVRWDGNRRVSVNISPVQFRDRDLPERILAALLRTGLPPERLEVEVTETVLVHDTERAFDILNRIRALGVRVALDDFGTGYSSLSYLRRFPFDKVKIDKSFVRDIETRRDSQVIVQAIRDIAIGLGMTITAEGVETEGQATQLKATGCHELQGYLYSRPRPAADLGPMMRNRLAA